MDRGPSGFKDKSVLRLPSQDLKTFHCNTLLPLWCSVLNDFLPTNDSTGLSGYWWCSVYSAGYQGSTVSCWAVEYKWNLAQKSAWTQDSPWDLRYLLALAWHFNKLQHSGCCWLDTFLMNVLVPVRKWIYVYVEDYCRGGPKIWSSPDWLTEAST